MKYQKPLRLLKKLIICLLQFRDDLGKFGAELLQFVCLIFVMGDVFKSAQ